MNDLGLDESLNNMYGPADWGVDYGVPSHLRPRAAGEYLSVVMVPKLWDEIHAIQKRMRRWQEK